MLSRRRFRRFSVADEMMKAGRFAVLLLAALAWGSPARAQAADTSAITTALWTDCPGAEVRLALASAETVRGRCDGFAGGSLVVRRGMDEWRVPLAEVDSAWVRGFGARHGDLIGGIAGGAAVGGAAVFVFNGICDAASGCGGDILLGGALATFIGYFSGSLFGGIIGRTVNGWDRRYP
jgi:hypothetical protein